MTQKKRLYTLIAFSLCFCLASGIQSLLAARESVAADSRQKAPASVETEPWESMAFFQKTGLLAHPGESAAEILMRAHKREPAAMFLAASGYAWGICGFPKDTFLAAAWVMELGALGDTATVAHVCVQAWLAVQPCIDDYLGVVLADCSLAQESVYADILRKVDTGNLSEGCAKAAEFKSSAPGWEKKHLSRLKQVEKIKAQSQAVASLMRELLSRPATEKEQDEIVEFTQTFSTDAALFFAATTHNPEKDVPDWSAERLLAFFTTQAEKKKMRYAFFELVREAGELLARRLPDVPDDVAQLIAKAHFGDIQAIYKVAEHYANGTSGFIKSLELSDTWLQHAALGRDYKTALVLATRLFAHGRLNQAWAWASIVSGYDDVDETLKVAAQRLTAKIEENQGENKAQDRENLKRRYTEVTVKMMEWRIGINKK